MEAQKKNNRKNKEWGNCTKSLSGGSSFSTFNLADNLYQKKSEVLYTFTPNESYAYLLNAEPINLVFSKTYNTEFDDIIITFTDQNGIRLEMEDKFNLKLLINK